MTILDKFQFYKVRLKVTCTGLRKMQFKPFQFYKVRLKAERFGDVLNGYWVFQFYKVRLKVRVITCTSSHIKFQFYKVRLKEWSNHVLYCSSLISIL